MKCKAYLDIDGVLLTKGGRKAKNAELLIDTLINQFDCYWLTTHCRHDENKSIEYLSNYFETHYIELLLKVKPAWWDSLKIEAINLNENFIWLEDYPLELEKEILKKANKESCLIKVNLSQKDEILRVVKQIQKNL